ncbi:Thiol-disulfide isomerase or thioredoxin [Paraoerskovia marina]|uniref:Thiol-disulfide isomerase or thioredoxin n=2 Tax=Paraoerskovia marina TaxID=545619 RepID=A0A1H1VLE5_9CELL|nr:Thiol-disulfide isomerase or thioredoxin [Paraoerskovia marina]
METPGMPLVRRSPLARARVLAALVLPALVLAGCAQDSGSTGTADALDQGYVSGDGSVRAWEPDERSEPVTITGTDYDGNAVDTSDYLGQVVLLNTWYAGCAPCRAEAPTLVDVDTNRDDVQVVGINGTDDAGTAQAFERTFEVSYPSIDDKDGSAVATLQGTVPLQAVPTTVLLDPEGRVAARVIGEVEPSTLDDLVDDAGEL